LVVAVVQFHIMQQPATEEPVVLGHIAVPLADTDPIEIGPTQVVQAAQPATVM
jgi:hypothetical protein